MGAVRQNVNFVIFEVINLTWVEYMLKAALHSKGSAEHWFHYLRKYIDKCGTVFSQTDVDFLCDNENLTPFQRVSLKAAFTDNSPTRRHIINLNEPSKRDVLSILRSELKGRNHHEAN